MARTNQRPAAREITDETVPKIAEETGRTGADILTMTARVAERSVERLSSMFGVGPGRG